MEKHLKETHSEKAEKLKCDKCDQQFFIKWRLRKHMEVHEKDVKFCHYYNNEKRCPFKEFGCRYKHENSPECYFKDRCKNKLCQYRHKLDQNKDSRVNILEPAETHSDVLHDTDSNTNETDTEQFRYDSGNILCEHYCTNWELSGPGYHMDTQVEFNELRGVNVKNISEEYDDNMEDFIKTYPCNVCEYKCNDLDELTDHIRKKHSNIEFKISCLCKTCDYTSKDPEIMHNHIRTIHLAMLKKLVKESKANNK